MNKVLLSTMWNIESGILSFYLVGLFSSDKTRYDLFKNFFVNSQTFL